jgi:hypothetical protein
LSDGCLSRSGNEQTGLVTFFRLVLLGQLLVPAPGPKLGITEFSQYAKDGICFAVAFLATVDLQWLLWLVDDSIHDV